MNEQIRELMGKTLDDEFSHTWNTLTYEELLLFSEKFAELIVRECAKRSAELGQPELGKGLMKHFGVAK
jgi:hypothetical protein